MTRIRFPSRFLRFPGGLKERFCQAIRGAIQGGDDPVEASGVGNPLFHETRLVWCEADANGLAPDFAGPLVIRSMPLGRIGLAATGWVPARHEPAQDGAAPQGPDAGQRLLQNSEAILVSGCHDAMNYYIFHDFLYIYCYVAPRQQLGRCK